MSGEAGVAMRDLLSLIRRVCICMYLFLAVSIMWLFMCLRTCVSERVLFLLVCLRVHGVMEAEGLWQVENGPGLFI